jgi:hypothetical protein
MKGLILGFTILIAYLFSKQSSYEDLIYTNCTFTNITITEKYFCSRTYKFIHKYYLTIEANNSYIKKEKLGSSTEYDLDKELINQTVPCYILQNNLYFSRPHILPPENKYITMFIMIFLGLMFEFMLYHELSF